MTDFNEENDNTPAEHLIIPLEHLPIYPQEDKRKPNGKNTYFMEGKTMTEAKINEIIFLLSEEKKNAEKMKALIDESGKSDIISALSNSGGYIQQAINILNAELLAAEKIKQAKANGDTKRLKVALSWQKRTKKSCTNERLKYPDYQEEFQVFCDGYVMIALKNHLGFEEKPEDLKVEYGLSFEKILPSYGLYDDEITEQMPDLSALKVWYKQKKKEITAEKIKDKTVKYYFGNQNDGAVNAEFLITAMEIMTSDTKWYRIAKTLNNSAFAHFYGENSIGEKCYICGLRIIKGSSISKTELV